MKLTTRILLLYAFSAAGAISYVTKHLGYGVLDIVIFGVNGAGKKEIFKCITGMEGRLVLPIDGNNQIIYRYDDYRFILWDLYYLEGSTFRYSWPDYLPSSPHAAILVIDASNAEAFSDTRRVLHNICAHQALAHCPLLVFANKSDLPNCMTVEKIHGGLDLAPLGRQGRQSAVFRCSAIQKIGVHQGMEWLVDRLERPGSALQA